MYISYSVPGTPTNLIISPESCYTLKINWTAPANNGEGLPVTYNLYLNEYYEYPFTVSNNEFSFMGNLTGDTEYTVTVVAVNKLGEGGNVTGTGKTREGMVLSYVLLYSDCIYVCIVFTLSK